MKTLGIGLLGCGTVGARVADRLVRDAATIEERAGRRCELRAIAIRDLHKRRPSSLDRALFTTDARSVVDHPHIDVVIELIGGVLDAGALLERALHLGRDAITANKALLGGSGSRLQALAASSGASLRFDAAVGGAIPILRTIDDALAGDAIVSVAGVLNGTCTAILSQMEHGIDFAAALIRAQSLGYAETDPSSDLDGTDSAYKLALVLQRAFGADTDFVSIRRKGIAGIAVGDVKRAALLGLRFRLIAAALRTEQGIFAEVAPLLISQNHEFARTTGAENVVAVESRGAGRLILRGQGAGGDATASSVLGDLVATVRGIGNPVNRTPSPTPLKRPLTVEPLFDALPRVPELPGCFRWDDAAIELPLRERASA